MRFVARKGTDPVARADNTLLKALGLPFGGVLKTGPTHFLVQGGDMTEPTALELGPLALANAGLSEGQSVEAVRAVLGPAEVVVMDVETVDVDPKMLVRGLQGRPVSNGDRVEMAGSYLSRAEAFVFDIRQVEPAGAGLIGAGTRFVARTGAGEGRTAGSTGDNEQANKSEAP